jgi:hypothetical protein
MSYDCTPIFYPIAFSFLYNAKLSPCAASSQSFLCLAVTKLPSCRYASMPSYCSSMISEFHTKVHDDNLLASSPIFFAVYLNFPLSYLPLPSATACWHCARVCLSNLSTASYPSTTPRTGSRNRGNDMASDTLSDMGSIV